MTIIERRENWRIPGTLDRLIANIPAACKVLREEGYISLAGQLSRDKENLTYWQERGGLTFAESEEGERRGGGESRELAGP